MSINFFTPVIFQGSDKNYFEQAMEAADTYWNFFENRQAVVIQLTQKGYEVEIKKISFSAWKTAVRIVLFATIIFPLLTIVIKAIARCTYSFHSFIRQNDNSLEVKRMTTLSEGRTVTFQESLTMPEVSFDLYMSNLQKLLDRGHLGYLAVMALFRKCKNPKNERWFFDIECSNTTLISLGRLLKEHHLIEDNNQVTKNVWHIVSNNIRFHDWGASLYDPRPLRERIESVWRSQQALSDHTLEYVKDSE